MPLPAAIVAPLTTPGLPAPQEVPADILALIRKSTLGDLFGQTMAIPFALTHDRKAQTHGADLLSGDFISCLVGYADLPKGTKGWLFSSRDYSYSKLSQDGEPLPGATVLWHGTYFTWVTAFTLKSGNVVLADCFEHVRFAEPKNMGTL